MLSRLIASRRGGRVVLDGGLATEIEALGGSLASKLWSARLLRDDPGLIAKSHANYVFAGADICITASYQAEVGLLCEHLEVSRSEASMLIASSVAIARAACCYGPDDRRPLVAGSIGPFGACLADGSEYTGGYAAMPSDELARWHRERFELLTSPGIASDFLAMETIPCRTEVQALCALLPTRPEATSFIALACSSGNTLNSGERVADAVADIERLDRGGQVEAIGVNCTSPRFCSELIRTIRTESDRPIVLYPNSGEQYDAATGMWLEGTIMRPEDFASLASRWYDEGAAIVGGCCRVGPDVIAAIRAVADEEPGSCQQRISDAFKEASASSNGDFRHGGLRDGP